MSINLAQALETDATIAAHLARVNFENLPAAAIEATKASVLDTIACMLAGSSSQDVAAIGGLVETTGGRPTSTIIQSGVKVPAAQAVLATGAEVRDLSIKQPSLEEVFIFLTGRHLR